jgi:hypothetical protein
MKRVIVTNNKKVEDFYARKNEVIMLDSASALDVLKEGEKVALKEDVSCWIRPAGRATIKVSYSSWMSKATPLMKKVWN